MFVEAQAYLLPPRETLNVKLKDEGKHERRRKNRSEAVLVWRQ